MIFSLDDLVAPLHADRFIEDFWGKSFTFVPGSAIKFSDLMPWSQLNRILEEHRFGLGRLRLFRSGQYIDWRKYLEHREENEYIIKLPEITNELAQGATLILNRVDELHRPVRELSVTLERVFRVYIGVNLYAGWKQDNGFDLHFDDHDTFILQVAGRKHWQVYAPTRLHPFKDHDVEPAGKPTEEPVWDGLLSKGEMFYIPRGWWHIARPVEEPCLHLTFSLPNPTGIDLLRWYVNELKEHVHTRMDVPHLAGPEHQLAYLRELIQAVQNSWGPDIIERFMGIRDGNARFRPNIRLPEAATTQGIMISEDTRLRLASPRKMRLDEEPNNGVIKFRFAGRTLQCSTKIVPALQKLNDGRSHTLNDLCCGQTDRTVSSSIRTFITALALQGVVIPDDGSNARATVEV